MGSIPRPREHKHFDRFRECFVDFPQGVVTCPGEPDFVVTTPEGNVGIEHTEVLQGERATGSNSRAEAVSWEGVCKLVRQFAEEHGLPNLDILISQRQGRAVGKARKADLAREIVDLVAQQLPLPEASYVRVRATDWQENIPASRD